ncbi:hypothetical protein AURDEDRAFT_117640 [Auricularia subglabra TFB-10046 SS5]|uniref:Uncharacterized protein n=1 Tax=Auricularia subglabra (strain TFB-10046 / SS5) TaxID=717982 RepID=J0WPL2_AURST|nr:hypothetical protein AURDEDRAFT_117640 [Auricularia subglabra TFB-10046 SS5]
MEDKHELELLAYIAEACPRLAVLELHCYRNVSDYHDLERTPLAVPLDDLSSALSAFSALRVVRLNIDFPWFLFSVSRYAGLHGGEYYTAIVAGTIARAVPWLDAVCVLTLDGEHVWQRWTVRKGDADVELEKLTLMGRGAVAIGKTLDF